MARPKHSPESRREHHIGVRFNASEYEKIMAESEAVGTTISAYIRAKALHGKLRIPKYANVNVRCINLLSKLGGLLKKTHAESGGMYSVLTLSILRKMERAMDILLRSLETGRNDRNDRNDR